MASCTTTSRILAAAVCAGWFAAGPAAWAQQPAGGGSGAGQKAAASSSKSSGKATSGKSSGESGGASSGGASEGGLKQRVEQLEEQLVDMQVVIGTLESLARSGGGAAPARASSTAGGSLGSGDQARIDGLETQVRALTQQVEQLSDQLRQARERRSDASAPSSYAAAPPPQRTAPPPPPASMAAAGDPIGSLISGGASGGSAAPIPATSAQLPPVRDSDAGGAPAGGGDPGGAKQAYEQAYGQLLQQDYGSAEAAFDDFLRKYPNDALAGNAQYWLGESFFVRGQYKQAATAFLKGYQTYGKSAKAPDSLLKLAMSLDRLGQKDAACSSYGELATRFPTAPAHIKSRAQSERQRLACS